MNSIAATYFRDENVEYPKNRFKKTYNDYFAARNIPDGEAVTKLSKIYHTRISILN